MKEMVDFSKIANSHIKPIAFDIVEMAMNGDQDAVDQVVKYYQPYIRKLASKQVFDRYGQTYTHLDEDLQSELNEKLLMLIRDFKILDE